ncbi:hypothetical protein V7659_04845, partial [Neobacillus drentensis]|uniref:hypothetical protein n=1 Tax=Neobacillus drentensis TaxID=220684 RepID=UPI003000AFBA
ILLAWIREYAINTQSGQGDIQSFLIIGLLTFFRQSIRVVQNRSVARFWTGNIHSLVLFPKKFVDKKIIQKWRLRLEWRFKRGLKASTLHDLGQFFLKALLKLLYL